MRTLQGANLREPVQAWAQKHWRPNWVQQHSPQRAGRQRWHFLLHGMHLCRHTPTVRHGGSINACKHGHQAQASGSANAPMHGH